MRVMGAYHSIAGKNCEENDVLGIGGDQSKKQYENAYAVEYIRGEM